MTNGDIHNRSRTLQRLKQQIKTSPDISERDKKVLVEGNTTFPSFLTYMENKDHSTSRVNRYLRTWKRLSERTEWELEDVSKTRITELIGDLNTDKICKKNGDAFAPSTKREIKKGIRKMYTDFFEAYSNELNIEDGFDGEEVINFTLTIDRSYTDADKLPNPFHVKELIENCEKPRDKAYIMLLWSTGGRHGEILGLQWQDVSFAGATGTVTFRDTKTGGDHTVPMAEAMPFVRQHMQNDQRSQEQEAYLFRSSQSGEQYSSSGAAKIIERAREDTDIPSHIKTNPHAFRKGRTVYWIRQGKNEAWICKHMNWKPGSPTVAHYARVAKEDVEQGVAKHLGLQQESNDREESRVLTPAECHECGEVNGFKADTCRSCGEALATGDLIRQFQVEEKTNQFMEQIITSETEFDPEKIEEKATEFVKKEFELD
ncbi:MAG: tyrosine-type recombinase/integrase [Candidatus Nanohalobium sp.]